MICTVCAKISITICLCVYDATTFPGSLSPLLKGFPVLSKQFLERVLHAKPQVVATSIACAKAAAASKRCAVVVMVIRKYHRVYRLHK